MSKVTLLIHCPDTSGIISAVTSYFYKKEGNIIYIDQYVDVENKNLFYAVGKRIWATGRN